MTADASAILRTLEGLLPELAGLLERLGAAGDDERPALLAGELGRLGYRTSVSRGRLYARPEARLRGSPRQLLLAGSDAGGMAVLVGALRTLDALSLAPASAPVVVVGGEPRLLRLLARGAARALVLGPPERLGRLWTARRGRGRFLVRARDAEATPWTSGDACARAILELTRQVPRLYGLADPVAGVSVEVGEIVARPRVDGDAPSAYVPVTVCAPTAATARGVEAAIRALEPLAHDTALEISGGFESPPMERLARTRALFGAAVRLGLPLGLAVADAPTAPAPSAANVTNPYTATLDGLGPVTADAAGVAERAALVALLMLEPSPIPPVGRRPRRAGGRVAIVGGAANESNLELVAGWQAIGIGAELVAPGAVRHDDVVVGRLDILPTLDGTEPGLLELLLFERRGLRVVNGAFATVRAHDKLRTARNLARAGVPHPWTVHLAPGGPLPLIAPPLVVKPRFGSWGADIFRCESRAELDACLAEIGERRWFRRHGALLQALVPPVGHDLRLLVAGGVVVGAIERTAPAGDWRTNISLGGTHRTVAPPELAREVALAAAAAIGADLVGVDLLPVDDGWTVLELNGAVEFDAGYSFDGGDVFREAAEALGLLARARPAAAPVLTGVGA